MAYNPIGSISASGNGSITTGSLDTTGADLLIIGLAIDDAYNTAPTDSKGNTWTQAPNTYTQTNVRVRLWYSIPTSVGSGHTFSAGTSPFGSLFAAAFSGGKQTSPADQQNGANGFVGTIQPGSITPTEDNELIIALLGINAAGTPISINSSFIETNTEINFGAGDHYGGCMAYLIQTAAAAVNPTWTRTNTNGCATTIISFKAAAAAVGQPTIKRIATVPFLGGSLRQRNF
jgi:hypothetical protein